jgi:hypothetical protein
MECAIGPVLAREVERKRERKKERKKERKGIPLVGSLFFLVFEMVGFLSLLLLSSSFFVRISVELNTVDTGLAPG